MIGYLLLIGGACLFGLVSVVCGVLAGLISKSTPAASFTAFLVYSGLLLIGCWLLYRSIPPDPVVQAQANGFIVALGGCCWLLGGSLCAILPIAFGKLARAW